MAVTCPICGGSTQRLLAMPAFPVTEKLEEWSPFYIPNRELVDQSFHYCEACCHGRLGTVVPDLYGDDYMTATGRSAGATQAVHNFYAFVSESVQPPETVIDIGANDYTLLNLFSAEHKLAIDECTNGVGIEDADLSRYKDKKKLIVSSHTIEHLVDPDVMIRKCAEVMNDDDTLALQFPSLEMLVHDARIDQIHHQHIHYFSQQSITLLLEKHDLQITKFSFDESHWGALRVIAHKGLVVRHHASLIRSSDIERAIRTFNDDIQSVEVPPGALGLGAALMLPVLAYWMPELYRIERIADDDKTKDGMRFVNFNKPIVSSYDLKDQDVVITAIGTKAATRALAKKAIDAGARRIIFPLHTI